MDILGATSSQNVKIVDKDKTGFNGLTADSFMKLLIAQLQNQDPTEPVGNDELLSQISTMRSLQSNIELGDAMKAITTNQQLSTAAGFIGRAVSGYNASEQNVVGIADRAFLRDGVAYLGVGSQEVPLSRITDVGLI